MIEDVLLLLVYVTVFIGFLGVGGVFADIADRRDARRRNHVSRRKW